MSLDWRQFRQQSALTLAIVFATAVIVTMLLPLDLRGGLLLIALVALLLGWVP